MIFSEFGRRVPENTSLGTDHGTANLMFVVGKPVKGGHYGDAAEPDRARRGDNLVYTTDFRRVYATVIDGWLGYRDTRGLLGATSSRSRCSGEFGSITEPADRTSAADPDGGAAAEPPAPSHQWSYCTIRSRASSLSAIACLNSALRQVMTAAHASATFPDGKASRPYGLSRRDNPAWQLLNGRVKYKLARGLHRRDGVLQQISIRRILSESLALKVLRFLECRHGVREELDRALSEHLDGICRLSQRPVDQLGGRRQLGRVDRTRAESAGTTDVLQRVQRAQERRDSIDLGPIEHERSAAAGWGVIESVGRVEGHGTFERRHRIVVEERWRIRSLDRWRRVELAVAPEDDRLQDRPYCKEPGASSR